MKASDWISVKDKLPKINERVLVCCEFDGELLADIATRVKNDIYLPNIDRWYLDDGFDTECVTHWQPIVLPKKENL